MTTFFLTIITSDPFIGRVDKFSLPQQTLMEMLIADLKNPSHILQLNSEVGTWSGVVMEDSTGEITQIDWGMRGLSGSINLKWIPLSVVVFQVNGNLLEGSAQLGYLPDSLEEISLSSNYLTGEIDLTSLPLGVQKVFLSKNRFSGSIDLSKLPPNLKFLSLRGNALTGSVRLGSLPLKLELLHLQENRFSGSVGFSSLPKSLYNLGLFDNPNLSGEVTQEEFDRKRVFFGNTRIVSP